MKDILFVTRSLISVVWYGIKAVDLYKIAGVLLLLFSGQVFINAVLIKSFSLALFGAFTLWFGAYLNLKKQ